MDYPEEIKKLLSKVTGISKDKISVEKPEREEHGDYSSNVALVSFDKSKSKSPRGLAENLANQLKNNKKLSDLVEKIEVAGPGFINFWLKKDTLNDNLKTILLSSTSSQKQGAKDHSRVNYYGQSSLLKNQKFIVEYSSPNIAKPFTIGHLRSTLIGDAIANILEAGGAKVYRDNHIGDWGTQFGKEIYAIKTWGNEKKLDKSKTPIKDLVALYIKFHEEAEKNPEIEEEGRKWFKKLEEGDSEAKRLWKKCIDWSWAEFVKIYKILGIDLSKFENNGRGYGEAFFEDKMDVVIQKLKEKKLLKESKGAQIVEFPGKLPPIMIIKNDGTTLYSTRDLATDWFRKNKYGDNIIIINEVGAEQKLYFQQIYKLEEMLGWFKQGQRIHIMHGLFRFADKKMSTRKGNVVWLGDVIDTAIQKSLKN